MAWDTQRWTALHTQITFLH